MKRYILMLLLLVTGLVVSGDVRAQKSQTKHTVTGVIKDHNGDALIGATVVIDGTTVGTSSGLSGEYSIKAAENAVLRFEYVGYEAQKITVGKRTVINVTLEQSKQAIEEVVVIGYGTVKKTDLTGAVSNVKMSDIKDIPVISVDQALQGRIAGADIMSTTGEPGAGTSIRIRGTRSISASNEPLIVVDGVMDAIHDLNDINSADIASISVLKDASSTAIYGARGSNGVIVITTKQGRSGMGRPNISFKTDLGFSQLPRRLDIMGADEFARYYNDYAYFATSDSYGEITPETPISEYRYPNVGTYGKGTDWVDVISRTAFYQNYDLSLSGSTEKTSYYASAGFNESEGIIDNSGMARYSSRFKIDHNFAKWFKAGLNISYTYRDQDRNLANIGGTSWWNSAIYLNPFLTPNSDVNDLWYSGQKYNNPRLILDHCKNNSKRSSLTNNVFVEFQPVKGLKINSKFTYYTSQVHNYRFEPGYLPAKKEGEGAYAYRSENENASFLSETTVNYVRETASGHNFNILAGFTGQHRYDNNFGAWGNGYSLDELLWNNMGAVTDKQNTSIWSSRSERNNMSVLGRIMYNYKERYHLTVTGRYDGASNFAQNNKWAFFPSAAVRWNIDKEKFMENVRWIDELALRASAGRSGNDAISAYRSLAQLGTSTNGYLMDGKPQLQVYPSRLASPNLTWETTDMYNLGIDASLFKGRLNITAEGYIVKTKDLLLTVQVASQTGYTNYFSNAGSTKNRGWEISIESHNIVRPKFSWSTSLTFSRNKQKVLDIASEDFVTAYSSPSIAGTSFMMYGYKKGYPLNALWGFRSAGVWHNEEEVERNKVTKAYASASARTFKPGYARYNDINHDGMLNNDDLVYLGSADPDLYGGIQNSFRIHNFSFSFFFSYSIGGKIYNISEIWMGNGSPYTNQYSYMANAWHPVRNPWSDLPFAGSNDALPSDRMVHDASYLRLKNVSASYTFDLRRLTKNRIRDIRLSVSGENLYLWKRYNGFDPDVSSSSGNSTLRRVDIGAYPKPRTIIFSLQIRY